MKTCSNIFICLQFVFALLIFLASTSTVHMYTLFRLGLYVVYFLLTNKITKLYEHYYKNKSPDKLSTGRIFFMRQKKLCKSNHVITTMITGSMSAWSCTCRVPDHQSHVRAKHTEKEKIQRRKQWKI